jgi:hypothetical protein
MSSSSYSIFRGVLAPPPVEHSRLPDVIDRLSGDVLNWPVIKMLRQAQLMLPDDFDGAVIQVADAAAEHTRDVWAVLDAMWKNEAGWCRLKGADMPSNWDEKAKKRKGGGLFVAPPSSAAAAGDRTFATQKQGNAWHKTHIMLGRLDSAESLCAVLAVLWHAIVVRAIGGFGMCAERAVDRLVFWDADADTYKCVTTKVAAAVGSYGDLVDERTLSQVREARAAVVHFVDSKHAAEAMYAKNGGSVPDDVRAILQDELVKAYRSACVRVKDFEMPRSLDELKRAFEVQGPLIGLPSAAAGNDIVRLHVKSGRAASLVAGARPRMASLRLQCCPTIAAPVGSLAALRDAFEAVDDRLLDARARVAERTGKAIGATTELQLKLLRENMVSELFNGLQAPSCIVVYTRTSRCLEVRLPKQHTKDDNHPVLVRVRPCGTPICPGVFSFAWEAAGVELLNRMQAGGDGLSGLFRRVGAITRECAMCGKTLKTEDSVQLGVGPECLERLQGPNNLPGINNEQALALARLPTDGVDSADLRRPTGRDVAERAATMAASAPPQVQLVRLALELKSVDGDSGVFTMMQEALEEDGMDESTAVTAALAHVCNLVGIQEPPDSDTVRTACIDLVHMHNTNMVPCYRSGDGAGYDDQRLLTAALLAHPLGMLQPIATWLKWRWTTDPMWFLPPR